MRELFVYYRVDGANAGAARLAARAMQEALRRSYPGLEARLLTRTDDDASAQQTWMETYALPGAVEGIDAGLESVIEAAAGQWRDLRAGPRHVEAFDRADSD